jgi:hypothetical protein
MPAMTFFYQECPVCGRSLRIRVQYYGREMSCTHCKGEFVAGQAEDSRQIGEEPTAEPAPTPHLAFQPAVGLPHLQ